MHPLKTFLCFLFLATLCFADIGKVVGIAEGDTLTLLTDKKETVKIRIFAVDAPESGQAFGKNAKEALSRLTFGKRVEFNPENKDRYGRVVSKITLPDGKDAGAEMLRLGMCWWYRDYGKKEKTYGELEETARKARVGLWRDKEPVAPWVWRKQESQ